MLVLYETILVAIGELHISQPFNQAVRFCSAEVLTSPTMQEQLPCDVLPADNSEVAVCQPDWAFVAGFRDCADDAVRYLTHVERLPENHDVIRGLRQHLSSREPDAVQCESERTSNTDEGYSSIHVDNDSIADVELSSSQTNHDSACSGCGISKDTDVTISVDSTGPTTDNIGWILSDLIQRDPRIASLTKEIFDLIDGTSDDDDYYVDDVNVDSTYL